MNPFNLQNKLSGILKLFLSVFVLALAQIVVNAQVNVFNGDWKGYFPDGRESVYIWRISQDGQALNIWDLSGSGTSFNGRINSANTISDAFGKTATLSADGKQLVWSDKVIWKKLATRIPPIFADGAKINLIADNGYRMSRCNGCQDTIGGTPDTVVLGSGESVFSTFEVRNDPQTGKIMLRADTGGTVTYCNGCITGDAVAENTLVETTFNAGNPFNKFELTKLSNGKYTLRTQNGKYLTRCNACSPSLQRRTGRNGDVVTGHGTDPNSKYSQWIILLPGQPNPLKDPAILTAPRFSYDGNEYTSDPTNAQFPWKWRADNKRTIYNPLDGGVLLKYTFDSQTNSDGCSGPSAEREKTLFREACLAHDTNYDAPFPLAGFPKYPNGASTGADLADYLFYKDMQLINDNARNKNSGLTNWINDSAAQVFFATVATFGEFRGSSTGKTILEKGGVIAVQNNGLYSMTLKVTWTSPDGVSRSADVSKPFGFTAVIPLSAGSSNIKVACSADGGTTIFTRNFAAPGMYSYSVDGTTLIHSVKNGLTDDRK